MCDADRRDRRAGGRRARDALAIVAEAKAELPRAAGAPSAAALELVADGVVDRYS